MSTVDALAAVAATTASFAQVTISGTFDPSFRSAKTTLGNGTSSTLNTMANNGQGTSSVNFSGKEDLGGGLSASFALEEDFDVTKGGNLTTGQSNLALGGSFGSVVIVP